MFNQNGLSLDQAPPFGVVLRFFLSGGVFGVLAGVFVMLFGVDIFDASTPQALIVTHSFTLGVMLSFMFGALFQMLPVIAGVKLLEPVKKANLLQYPFVVGTISLLVGFYDSYNHTLLGIALVLLGGSISYIVYVMLSNLLRVQNHSASSKGMSVSLIALGMLLLMALLMVLEIMGIGSIDYSVLKSTHFSFGLFGWIALLIISISFQVIEMFYVTPPYPLLVSKYLPFMIFGVIVLSFVLQVVGVSVWGFVSFVLALILIAYAGLTLYRLTQRKRPIADATVWFWRVGMSSLIVSMLFFMLTHFITSTTIDALSYITFASFALSIVFAMFYKIVPFLTWFHLNSQGYLMAPMMHEVIHPKSAMKHLYIHIASLVTFVLSVGFGGFIYLAGVLLVVSFGLLTYQVIHAHKLYIHTQQTQERFDMGMKN